MFEIIWYRKGVTKVQISVGMADKGKEGTQQLSSGMF